MKYIGMPMGMWVVFAGAFRRQLAVLGYDAAAAEEITRKAKPRCAMNYCPPGSGKRTFPAAVYAPARRICMMNITETLSEL